MLHFIWVFTVCKSNRACGLWSTNRVICQFVDLDMCLTLSRLHRFIASKCHLLITKFPRTDYLGSFRLFDTLMISLKKNFIKADFEKKINRRQKSMHSLRGQRDSNYLHVNFNPPRACCSIYRKKRRT